MPATHSPAPSRCPHTVEMWGDRQESDVLRSCFGLSAVAGDDNLPSEEKAPHGATCRAIKALLEDRRIATVEYVKSKLGPKFGEGAVESATNRLVRTGTLVVVGELPGKGRPERMLRIK